MPWIYREEPIFTIPRRNYYWVSDYDFLYEKLRRLEERVAALERAHESKEDKNEVHSG
jgi:hypothetical protein